MARNGIKSPSFDVAASASGANAMIVGESDERDQRGEHEDTELETEAEGLGRQIACRCSERESQ
jgi:hypothetical protein